MARRGFLRAMGATVIVSGGFKASTGQTQQAVPWSSGTEPPNLKAPPNACDCHMHIYDSRFPVAPDAKLRPPDATVDAYRLLQKRIGTTRQRRGPRRRPTGRTIPGHPRRDGQAYGPKTPVASRLSITSVADAELKRLKRSRHSRHPLQSRLNRAPRRSTCLSPCRSGSMISAGTSRSIMLRRPNRRECGPSAAAAFADRLRPSGAHSLAGRPRSIRHSHWC